MIKTKGRHTRMPREARWVGPVFAYEAIRLALAAKREMESASAAQNTVQP